MFKRKKEIEKLYQEKLKSMTQEELDNYDFKDEKEIIKFKWYRIVENSYPYDGFKKHHLLLENEKVNIDGLDIENMEIFIARYYDHIVENTTRKKSVKRVFHKHLLKI